MASEIMRSYFLQGIATGSEQEIEDALSKLLPGQKRPWLITADDGDPISYLDICRNEGVQRAIIADISGRHYGKDVTENILKALRALLGGFITDDDGAIVE